MRSEGIESNLKAIVALCNNPHWQSDRRWRIAELAEQSLREVQAYKRTDSRFAELDDEVSPGCTDDD